MVFFDFKKDPTAYHGAMEHGAIPVATPVPDHKRGLGDHRYKQPTSYQQHQNIQHYSTRQQQLQQQSTHMVHQSNPTLAREPMMMRVCPNCQQESRTRITTYPTWQTWTAAGALLVVFWPICWVPLILDNCKQTDHHCVLCGAKVGKVDAFQDCCVTERA